MPRNRKRTRAAVDKRVMAAPPASLPAPEAPTPADPPVVATSEPPVSEPPVSEPPASHPPAISPNGSEPEENRPSDVEPARATLGQRLGRLGWPGALVLIAMLVGAVPRLVRLEEVPPGFHQDEAVVVLDAYTLLYTARDHLGHPFNLVAYESFGDWQPPVPVMLAMPSVALFGLDVWSARASTAIQGLLLIPVIYLLAVRLFDRKAIGVTAAWLVALLPWHIHQSRYAIQPSVVPLIVALIMLGIVWTACRQTNRAAVATAFAIVAGIATYHALRVQVPLLILMALIAFWPRLIRLRRSTLAVGAAIVAFVAIPAAVFVVFDEAGGARARQVSIFTEDSAYLPPGTEVDLGFIVGQYLDYFSPDFLFRSGDGLPQIMLPETGILPLALLPLLLVGIGTLIWAIVRPRTLWHRQVALFLLLALVIFPVPGFLTLPSPQTARSLHVIPLVAVIAGLGTVTIADLIDRLLRRTGIGLRIATVPIVVALALGAFTAEAIGQLREYFRDYPKLDPVLVVLHYGLSEAVDYAIEHQEEYDEIWITDSNQPYIYVLLQGDWRASDIQEGLVVRRNPPNFNSVVAFENFRFPVGIRSGPPVDIEPATLLPIFTTTYPDGQAAYEVRQGYVPNRGRVLLIHRP